MKIIHARKYGGYYFGDLERDTIDALEKTDYAVAEKDATLDSITEIIAQFPDEDFLQDNIDTLRDCCNNKPSKQELLKQVELVLRSLERIQQTQTNATEYAYSLKRVAVIKKD
ncbi:acyl-coenzyme A thioesterase 11 [Pectobacterium phage POP12]|nr:acyl-coenzyme A thioesterase 11 [Pectobacterium phage POP12]